MVSKEPSYPNDIKHYEKIRIIGKGSYGWVYEAIVMKGNHLGEHVTIKQVNLEEWEDKKWTNLCNEITIMTEMKHENLIRTYIAITKYNQIYIVMPLMSYGDWNLILQFKFPDGIADEAVIATIMRDCWKAISCLNENSLFHRDIKASNILFSSDGSCRWGDYGVSTVIKKQGINDSYVGSLCWMAPEIANRTGHDFKVDIWSLGITAIEIAHGKPPFVGWTPFQITKKLMDEPAPQLVDKKKVVWSDDFREFLKSCLIKDPAQRPSALEILELHKSFFSKAKDKAYILENVWKGIPFIQDRFPKLSKNMKAGEGTKQQNTNQKVNWNFGNITNNESSQSETSNVNTNEKASNWKDMFSDLNEE